MSEDDLRGNLALFSGDTPIETRVLGLDRRKYGVLAGYFERTHFTELVAAAAKADELPGANTYFTLNPIRRELLARASNRLARHAQHTTSDDDIVARQWILVDLDPIRPSGIASTDGEHVAALQRAEAIAAFLADQGVPTDAMVRIDSGNGAYVLVRVDLENSATVSGLVRGFLAMLDLRFTDHVVKVDTSVANPARLARMPGTMNRKGDSTSERPHRRSKLLWAPSDIVSCPAEVLTSLAGQACQSPGTRRGLVGGADFDLDSWIACHAPEAEGPYPWQDGRKWVQAVCWWNPAHTNRSAYIVRFPTGAIAAGCHHNGCADKGWSELRELLEPGWRASRTRPPSASTRRPNRPSDHPDEGQDVHQEPPSSFRSLPSYPEPLAPEAFHGLAGNIVRAIAPHSEADPAGLLMQLLAVFGNVTGRCAYFPAEADHHFTNLFVALVGETAKGRKGTSWGQIRRIVGPVDTDWTEYRIVSGLSSGEGLIHPVRDPVMKWVRGEEEEVDAGVPDKRLLVMESELATALRVLTREGNTLSGIIRQAWETGNLQTLVKNSPTRATRAHITIIGHITRDELRRYLDRTEVANGLANRFLWCCVRRAQLLPHGGDLQDGDLVELHQRLADTIAFARSATVMKRDAQANAFWEVVYGPLSEGKPGLLGAVLGRAEAQVMRVALLYALLDRASAIQGCHLLAALAVWDYCEASARYIFGEALGDPVADDLLRALRLAGPSGMTRTQIRDFFGRNRQANEIGRALGTLLEHRFASYETRKVTGGRPAETWFARTTLTTDTLKGGPGSTIPSFSSYLDLGKEAAAVASVTGSASPATVGHAHLPRLGEGR